MVHVLKLVPRHMLEHMPGHVFKHEPNRHVSEYVFKDVPKHVLMPDKHVLEHVPKHMLNRTAHAVLMTEPQHTT